MNRYSFIDCSDRNRILVENKTRVEKIIAYLTARAGVVFAGNVFYQYKIPDGISRSSAFAMPTLSAWERATARGKKGQSHRIAPTTTRINNEIYNKPIF